MKNKATTTSIVGVFIFISLLSCLYFFFSLSPYDISFHLLFYPLCSNPTSIFFQIQAAGQQQKQRVLRFLLLPLLLLLLLLFLAVCVWLLSFVLFFFVWFIFFFSLENDDNKRQRVYLRWCVLTV